MVLADGMGHHGNVTMGMAVIGVVVVCVVVVMVVAVNRRPGDLVADKEDHRLEQIGEGPLRSGSRPKLRGDPGKQQGEDAGEHHFQDHILRDAESRLHREEAVERPKRLRNEDFAVHRLIEFSDIGDVGAAVAQELRHIVERLPSLSPEDLRHLEEVAVFEVVDRVVVGHRGLVPWLPSACRRDRFFNAGRRV